MATTIVPLSGPGTTIIPTGGPSTVNPALGVNQSNLVRYAKGQPTLVDPGGYVSAWSYDEDTGTLSATLNAIPSQLGPVNGPHFQWEVIAIDGSNISGVDAAGDAHFLIYPLVTDMTYTGGGGDRPSVGVGLSDVIGSIGRGTTAVWNQTGASTAGASIIKYNAGSFENYSGIDTAPSAGTIGAILTYDCRSIFGTNATIPQDPRASGILPTGDYDSGHEAFFNNIAATDFTSNRYLDVFLGCAAWSGGTGSVGAGETLTMTVAAIALPFFPRFLGSNFIKQP